MLWTLIAILLVVYLLGLGGVYTVGSILHLLLVLIAVILVVELLRGRRR